MKVCKDCGQQKERSEFYKNKNCRDALFSYCKACHRKRSKKWSEENSERHSELIKTWEVENRERVAEYKREERQKKPEQVKAREELLKERDREKYVARRDLKLAVYHGRVKKPDVCEDCGSEVEKRRLHGHHDDYSKKYEVAWLCKSCHDARHREMATA